jgi:hypothetical protein
MNNKQRTVLLALTGKLRRESTLIKKYNICFYDLDDLAWDGYVNVFGVTAETATWKLTQKGLLEKTKLKKDGWYLG